MNMKPYQFGKLMMVSPAIIEECFIDGWASHESSYIWAIAERATILLPLQGYRQGAKLKLHIAGFTGFGKLAYQSIVINLCGLQLGHLRVDDNLSWHELDIPDSFDCPDTLEIEIIGCQPISPKSCGVNDDERTLALRIAGIQICSTEPEMDLGLFDQVNLLAENFSQLSYHNLDSKSLIKVASYKKAKLDSLFNRGQVKEIFLSNFFKSADLSKLNFKDRTLHFVDPGDLNKISLPDYSAVILTNNDCHYALPIEQYKNIYLGNRKTVFMIWDYDNHHWLSQSLPLALLSDIYTIAHHEHFALLSLLSSNPLKVIPCGVTQFSIQLLEANLKELTIKKRKQEPLGKHVLYNRELRNLVIENVGRRYPMVGFTDGDYQSKGEVEHLKEWSSYTCSFISPVFGDVPIRVFDSLITGGIPIVPFYIRDYLIEYGVLPAWFVVYGLEDTLNPDRLVLEANEKFANGGSGAIKKRIEWTIENHHITKSLNGLLTRLSSEFRI